MEFLSYFTIVEMKDGRYISDIRLSKNSNNSAVNIVIGQIEAYILPLPFKILNEAYGCINIHDVNLDKPLDNLLVW